MKDGKLARERVREGKVSREREKESERESEREREGEREREMLLKFRGDRVVSKAWVRDLYNIKQTPFLSSCRHVHSLTSSIIASEDDMDRLNEII